MKILFINTGPWGTGSFTLVQCLTNEFLKRGHQVKIFFPDGDFPSLDKEDYYNRPELYTIWQFPLKNNDVSIDNFPLMITDPHPRNPQAITFKALSEAQLNLYENELKDQLSAIIKAFQPDIIECHHIWYPSWILKEMNLPYILTAHHSDQMGFHYDPKVRNKAIESAQHAKSIIAISDSVKDEVIELYHMQPNKITVIPNGYDDIIFKPLTINKQEILAELNIQLEPNTQIISFAGKLSYTKGIDLLLQASEMLNPAFKVHFIIMGAGDIEPFCKALNIDRHQLNKFSFVGQQPPEMVAKINNCSFISVMPSRSEGFGIASLEALACGLPVIATRCGGLVDFIIGKVIDIESPDQIATAITELLLLPEEEYNLLRKQAIEVAKQFSTSKITDKHLELYQSLKLME